MRILHLCAIPQLTGAAEPALDLVRAQRALGAEVELRVDTKRSGNLIALLESAGEKVDRSMVLSTKAGAIAAAGDLWTLRSLVKRFDVVHTHLSHDHTLAHLSGARKIVRTVHAARVLERGYLLKRAAGLTVASTEHRDVLVKKHEIDAAKILVLPGSVDARRFHPDPQARAKVRASLGLGEDVFVVGSVARFQAGRKHEVMIDAIIRARREDPALRLMLIGHGETEEALRARAEEAGEGVIFPGYKREDLNDWLCALDAALWLVPGNDATSRAVLQAMAVGLPVIGGGVAGDGDAISETIVHGDTGLLVRPDPDDVAGAMLMLARDRHRAKAIGAAGLLRARTVFDPLERGRRALAFYETI